MSLEISECSFEESIEWTLTQGSAKNDIDGASLGAETLGWFAGRPGGYRKRVPEDYDRGLCLVPEDVLDFVLATQANEWNKLKQHHGTSVKEQFLQRVSSEIARRGALDVLRHGVKDSGVQVPVGVFPPIEWAERSTPAASRCEPLRGHSATAFQ